LTDFNCDKNLLLNIVNILDLGFKFIPCPHFNTTDIIKSFLISFDKNINSINKSILLNKVCKNKNSSTIEFINSMDNSTLELPVCDSLDCVLPLLKSKLNHNCKLLFDTLDYRLSVLKHLNDLKFTIEPNISFDQFNHLKQFIKLKPFKITDADKNIGSIVLTNQKYMSLGLEHLKCNAYRKLDYNPFDDSLEKISITLSYLEDNKHLSKDLKKLLSQNNSKMATFRLLPKLHKTKFSIRPIVNCKNSPTSKLCQFVDLILKPMVNEISTILKDSQALLQTCVNLNYKEKLFLYSCDFESLYTNIDQKHLIRIISEYVSDKLKSRHIDIIGFNTILSLILENNIFSFNKDFYLQIIGLAMGIICGPTLANLYVYLLEKHWLHINNPLVYGRLIDDIFIASIKELNYEDFVKQFHNLKLNICHNKVVNFLDLNINYDFPSNKLKFSLFIKPTNTFSYLLYNSNHKDHIFKNIPKSLFIRIRRICTEYVDYLYFSRMLTFQLITRGHKYETLRKISRTIGNIDRNQLLPYKAKPIKDPNYKTLNNFSHYKTLNNFSHSNIFLKLNYDKSLFNIDEILQKSFSSDSFPNCNLNIISKGYNNLGSILIHNFPLDHSFKRFKMNKCNLLNCTYCDLVETSSYFYVNNIRLPIMSSGNCSSINCIYIIFCNYCREIYVGQTYDMRQRLYQHIYSIKTFVPFYKDKSEIARHFNLKNHDYKKHFSFIVFRHNIENRIDRLSIEADLINIILKINNKILNEYIPTIYKIESLAFNACN
jgi:hypothetical protein